MKRVLICLVAGLVVTASAGAQTPTGRDRARAALPPDVFRQVDVLVASAIQDGLPAEPLWDKALEGAAKRVPPPRITPVVAEYSSRLRTARGALGGVQAPATLIAAADALRRGVPQDVLGLLGPSDQRTPIALVVLGDLVETGVPADRALDVVREALLRRAADEDMLGLGARVRAAMRRGQSADAAADGVRRAISDRRVGPRGDAVGPPAPPGFGAHYQGRCAAGRPPVDRAALRQQQSVVSWEGRLEYGPHAHVIVDRQAQQAEGSRGAPALSI